MGFYSEVVGLVVTGGVLGFAIAKGDWSFVTLMAALSLTGIVGVCHRHAPGAAERRNTEARRRQAELDYEQQQRW